MEESKILKNNLKDKENVTYLGDNCFVFFFFVSIV